MWSNNSMYESSETSEYPNDQLTGKEVVFDLSLTRDYIETMGWGVTEAIHEVVKNAIEAATSYSNGDLLYSSGKWQLQPLNLPKFVQQLGFKYGYEARCTLAVGDGNGSRLFNELSHGIHWINKPQAVAQFKACYASRNYVDINDIDYENAVLEDLGLVLYQLVTENRVVDFSPNHIVFMGQNKNLNRSQSTVVQEGLGEGLKLSALGAMMDGFTLEVQGGGKRYRYALSPFQEDGTLQNLRVIISKPTNIFGERHDLVQVKLTRESEWQNEARFFKDDYRVLSKENKDLVVKGFSGGEILLDPKLSGKIFCRGILIFEWRNLFGFDIDFALSRDRNKPRNFAEMKVTYGRLLQEVLIDASQAEKSVARHLLQRLEECQYLSLEAEVITDSMCDAVGISAKALATQFKNTNGERAFPCRDFEIPFVQQHFPHKTPMPLTKHLMEILYRGGYRNPLAELSYTFSKQNASLMDLDAPSVTIAVEKAIYNLKQIGMEQISSDMLVFLNRDSLPPKRSMCHYSNGLFFLNDALLNNQDSLEDRAYMLGYYIASECDDEKLLRDYVKKRIPRSSLKDTIGR